MTGYIPKAINIFPRSKLKPHLWVHFQLTQLLPTGHIGVTCCLYSQCIQHVPGGYFGPCPQCLRLGVARVHLIYQTLRNAEGTTPKLNHYPSEAPALRRALRPRVASCDAPALRPYELRRVPTTLRRFPTMLRCFSTMLQRFSTMLRRIFTMLRRTAGLDRF